MYSLRLLFPATDIDAISIFYGRDKPVPLRSAENYAVTDRAGFMRLGKGIRARDRTKNTSLSLFHAGSVHKDLVCNYPYLLRFCELILGFLTDLVVRVTDGAGCDCC